jgi:hypothetical protein
MGGGGWTMLSFAGWMDLLLMDADEHGNRENILAFSADWLRTLYEEGCLPTCEGIALHCLAA